MENIVAIQLKIRQSFEPGIEISTTGKISLEEFNLKKGIIITEDFEGDEKVRNKEIIYVPLWKWLLLR